MLIKKFYFKKIKSTNDQAIKKIKKGIDRGIILTDLQTHGRGRHGKKWISIKGNLFMTIFYKINIARKLQNITKYNCTIVKNALEKYTEEKITIKRPNDILIKKKKISGILQEIIFFSGKKFIIIGIGVNVSASPKINNYKTSFLNNFVKRKLIKFLFLKL